MKAHSSEKKIELKTYRERRLRRRRLCALKANRHLRINPTFKSKYLSLVYSNTVREWIKHGYLDECFCKFVIKVPKRFTFKHAYQESLMFFKEMLSSFFYSTNKSFTLDFTDCQEISISTLTLFQVVYKEMMITMDKYNKGLYYKTNKDIKIRPSKYTKVNKYLNAFGFISLSDKDLLDDITEYLPLNLHSGKKRNYKENKKAVIATKISQYLSSAIGRAGVELNDTGRAAAENMIGEIIGNAEDHSLKNSCWYVDGLSFVEVKDGKSIIEFNLAIINFGKSMYDAFEETKTENRDIYQKLENKFQKHKSLFTCKNEFSRESLFMMYMLNEGISRLKYKEKSRGNGTMNFIESFIELGVYSQIDSSRPSRLNIISGNTILTCDHNCKPYQEGGHRKLSLNKSKNLNRLPDKEYISYCPGLYFPGTILESRIYMNEEFFTAILNNEYV